MRKLITRRAFLMVFALLLTTFIAVIALALLGLRKGGYASSTAVVNSVQARSLARSGIADIWVKLSKDPLFPGGAGDDQLRFSFREDVTDTNGNFVGSYRVIFDRKDRLTHEVLRIESTGIVGNLTEESSRHTIYAELSTVSGDFRFKVWQEGTSPRL
ncbi:MAG: hypothetical protein WC314_22795 [Vulcanimicrobiota bacterium]